MKIKITNTPKVPCVGDGAGGQVYGPGMTLGVFYLRELQLLKKNEKRKVIKLRPTKPIEYPHAEEKNGSYPDDPQATYYHKPYRVKEGRVQPQYSKDRRYPIGPGEIPPIYAYSDAR